MRFLSIWTYSLSRPAINGFARVMEASPGRNRLNFYFDIQFTAKPPFNYIYQGF